MIDRAFSWVAVSIAAIVSVCAAASYAAVVVPVGFTATPYATALPNSGGVAQVTMDAATRNLYYTDGNFTGGALRKLAPGGAVSTVISNFTAVDPDCVNFFLKTDIEFYNGSVYIPFGSNTSFNDRLVATNVTTGAQTILASLPGYGPEAGLAVRNGKFYVSSGAGNANKIAEFDPATNAVTTFSNFLSQTPTTVEYDPLLDRFYTIDLYSHVISRVNSGGGAPTAIPGSSSSDFDNFVVDPNGLFVYGRFGNQLLRKSLTVGTVTTFATGLGNGGGEMTFGPSSSNPLVGSLYVVDSGSNVIEISGFASVPEPSSVGLIAFATTILCRQRRR